MTVPVIPADYVILPRNALFEFFGRMALPPWQEEDGRWIGGSIDCAPIADEISRWVDEHDLSSLYQLGGRAPTITVYCNECGQPITMTEPDLSENGRICGACAVRISLGDKP